MKHGLEGINLYNPLEGKLPQVIDYFVEFYGEENREKITQRLSDADYIFADRVLTEDRNYLEQYFYKLKRDKLLSFQEDVRKGLHVLVNFHPDNIKDCFDHLEKWKEGIKEKDILPVFEFFQHILTDIRTPRDLEFALSIPPVSTKIYKVLNNLYEIYEKGGYKEAFDFYEREENHLAKLDDEEYVAISTKFQTRFKRQSECLILDAFIRKLKINPTMENVGKLLEISPYIVDYIEIEKIEPKFEKALLEKLTNELRPISALSSIKVAGNSEKNEDFFQKAVKDTMDSLESDIVKIRDSEFFGILSARAGLFDKLEHIYEDYLLGEDCIASIQEFMLSKELAKGGFNACVVSRDNPTETKNVCVNNSYLALDDESIIHEMNHVLSSYAKFENGIFYQKTGIRNQAIELFDDDARILYETFHKYTAIDEIINEYLAQQVVKNLRRDDFKIGYRDSAEVLYRSGFPLLEDFINENMQEIKDCYLSDDFSLIYKYFDKNGFDQLAKAADDLLKICRSYKTYSKILDDIEYQIGTGFDMFEVAKIGGIQWQEETKEYLDCYVRAEKAIELIRNAKETKNTSNSENDKQEEKDD